MPLDFSGRIMDIWQEQSRSWNRQRLPLDFFKQYIPFVDIIEYESRARFWVNEKGKTPHVIDPFMIENIRDLKQMIRKAGRESIVDLIEDGGINAVNSAQFVHAGMTVGEYSSALLKGPDGEGPGNRFIPGTGKITNAVKKLRSALDMAASSR